MFYVSQVVQQVFNEMARNVIYFVDNLLWFPTVKEFIFKIG